MQTFIIPVMLVSLAWGYVASSYAGAFAGLDPFPLSEHWWTLIPLTLMIIVFRFISPNTLPKK